MYWNMKKTIVYIFPIRKQTFIEKNKRYFRSFAQSTVHPTNLRQVEDFAKKGLYG